MPPHDAYIETHLGGGAVLRNKRPAEVNIGVERDPRVVQMWKAKYPSSQFCIVEGNAIEFLASYSFTGRELVYSDPPYVASTRRRDKVYTYDHTLADHHELLTVLTRLPCMVMLSGYDNELYNDTLSEWYKVAFQAKTHTDVRTEYVWFNYPPPTELHDTRFLGTNFRQRQTVQRRRERLYKRIAEMTPVERNALIQWLGSTYGPRENTQNANCSDFLTHFSD